MLRLLNPLILLLLLFCRSAGAQDLKGHVKQVNNLFIPYPDTLIWFTDQTLEGRIELKWDAFDWLRIESHARNRFIYGDFVERIPNYHKLIGNNRGLVDLSFLWTKGQSFIGHTEFDRLFARVNLKSAELTIGRQRINWGIDLVWNPNDIFNTFSYLNLEYPERPGTDAVNLKVYTGSLSFFDFVYQPRKATDSSAYGVRYRTNVFHTDFQVMLAHMAGYNVLGGGISSELAQFAIRSELTYFHAEENNTKGGLVATLSVDRSFGSNSFVQVGALLNTFGGSGNYQPISLIEPRAKSPMMLSRGKINLFVGLSSTIGSLYTPSISMLANPADGSAAIIPSIGYSASDNILLSVTAMLLTGKSTKEYANVGQLVYFKVQWNF